jgi:hypothetical protein
MHPLVESLNKEFQSCISDILQGNEPKRELSFINKLQEIEKILQQENPNEVNFLKIN